MAVIGVPDDRWGEVGKAMVVKAASEDPAQDPTEDDILAFAREHLAGFKVPTLVRFHDTQLPRNASGKILKRDLRDALAD